MKVKNVNVDSLADFVSKISEYRDIWGLEELWFRGVRSSRMLLRPSLYRPPLEVDEKKARKREDEARIEFGRRGRVLLSEREPRDELEWYILMRHSDVPTRLLDWTEGHLLALYFAVRDRGQSKFLKRNPPKTKSYPAVWVLDPYWLNKRVVDKNELLRPSDSEVRRYLPKPRSKRKKFGLPPVAFLPPYLNRQMATQRSVFTIQGRADAFDQIASGRGEKRLIKIVIRRPDPEQLCQDLESCGITEETVFPDLRGLGVTVTESFLSR